MAERTIHFLNQDKMQEAEALTLLEIQAMDENRSPWSLLIEMTRDRSQKKDAERESQEMSDVQSALSIIKDVPSSLMLLGAYGVTRSIEWGLSKLETVEDALPVSVPRKCSDEGRRHG